jgi:hypothetical protein
LFTVDTVWLRRYVLFFISIRDTTGRIRRLYEQPVYGVDDPAGAEPADGPRRP